MNKNAIKARDISTFFDYLIFRGGISNPVFTILPKSDHKNISIKDKLL